MKKKKMNKKILILTSIMALGPGLSQVALAASANANATASVIAALGISKTADLAFGEAIQGDSSQTIAPGGSGGASFDVSGEPSRAYTVTLPADSTIVMITDDGVGADKQIAVDSFLSNPAAGANGLLDGSGAQTLNVGATRAAIGATQVTGSYTASFTVTVVY